MGTVKKRRTTSRRMRAESCILDLGLTPVEVETLLALYKLHRAKLTSASVREIATACDCSRSAAGERLKNMAAKSAVFQLSMQGRYHLAPSVRTALDVLAEEFTS